MNGKLNIHLDPPDSSRLLTWRSLRKKCDFFSALRFHLAIVGFGCVLGWLFTSDYRVLHDFFLLTGIVVLSVRFFLRRWCEKFDCSDLPQIDDFDPASLDHLARLSSFLDVEPVKVYLRKVAEQQRPLTRMECQLLIFSPEMTEKELSMRAKIHHIMDVTGLRIEL